MARIPFVGQLRHTGRAINSSVKDTAAICNECSTMSSLSEAVHTSAKDASDDDVDSVNEGTRRALIHISLGRDKDVRSEAEIEHLPKVVMQAQHAQGADIGSEEETKQLQHRSVDEVPYSCNWCWEQCKDDKALKAHQLGICGVYKECSTCSKAFYHQHNRYKECAACFDNRRGREPANSDALAATHRSWMNGHSNSRNPIRHH